MPDETPFILKESRGEAARIMKQFLSQDEADELASIMMQQVMDEDADDDVPIFLGSRSGNDIVVD